MTDFSITPPPKLVRQWLEEYYGTRRTGEVNAVERHLATQAARWGANQRLEACCEWMKSMGSDGYLIAKLRAVCHSQPKPKGLPADDPYMEDCSEAVLNRARQIDETMGVNVYGPHEPDTCASSWFTSKLIASLEERISTLESLSD